MSSTKKKNVSIFKNCRILFDTDSGSLLLAGDSSSRTDTILKIGEYILILKQTRFDLNNLNYIFSYIFNAKVNIT